MSRITRRLDADIAIIVFVLAVVLAGGIMLAEGVMLVKNPLVPLPETINAGAELISPISMVGTTVVVSGITLAGTVNFRRAKRFKYGAGSRPPGKLSSMEGSQRLIRCSNGFILIRNLTTRLASVFLAA
jgi:hypothetical protein